MYAYKESPEEYKARKERVAIEREAREARRQMFAQQKEERRIELEKKKAENELKYEFVNTLLKWRIDDGALYCPEERAFPINVRQRTYDNNREYYFRSFIPLVLEESRAIVKVGLDKFFQKKSAISELKIIKSNYSKHHDMPSVFTLSGKIISDGEDDYGASVIMLYEINARIFMLADIFPTNQIAIKCFLNSDNQHLFGQGAILKICALGSLVTQKRIYDVCKNMPLVNFERYLLNPHCDRLAIGQSFEKKEYYVVDKRLNVSQNQAVNKFIQLEQGLQLLQGPPGTGKTTTLVVLLEKLLSEGPKRILVSAPSNKAVQVLADKFLSLQSAISIPVILLGVEKKLDDKLRVIFLHGWKKHINDCISSIVDELDKLIINQLSNFESMPKSDELSKRKREAFLQKLQLLSMIMERFKALEIFHKYGLGKVSLLDAIIVGKLDLIDSKSIEKLKLFLNGLSSDIGQTDGDKLEQELLKVSQVIFATLSVTGRQSMEAIEPVDILIVDEAAQAVEAETLIPFAFNPRKCLLVGDTKQLPATVISRVAVENNYNWSMMWRLIEECKADYMLLDTQYRMESDICLWPSKKYYSDMLKNCPEIMLRSNPLLPEKEKIFFVLQNTYMFIDVLGREENIGCSFKNQEEVGVINNIVEYFCNIKGIAQKRISIISFYQGQVFAIRKLLQRDFCDVKINTVDSFQGDENDLIIISFVRANPKGDIGFLKDFRRLNVALTRAKFMLIMLGNVEELTSKNSDIRELIKDAQLRNKCFSTKSLLAEIKPVIVSDRKPSGHMHRHGMWMRGRGQRRGQIPRGGLRGGCSSKFDQSK